MDEKEQQELAKEMEDISVYGHVEEKKQSKRKGRGFSWNSQTGKYTKL